jgi:hypothetical protein
MGTTNDRFYHMGGVPVGGDLLGNMGDGRVIFLDPGKGGDENTGTNPSTDAVATAARAYALITDGQGDVVIRLPGTEAVTTTLNIDKSHSAWVAATAAQSPPAGRGAGAEYYLMWGAALTTEVLTVDKNTSFNGMSFACAATAVADSSAAVRYTSDTAGDQPGFTYIINCEFPSWGSNNAGLGLDGANHLYIARNSFGGASGTLPRGIYIGGGSQNNCVYDVIEDNIFGDCTIGIDFPDGTPQNIMILKNFFSDLGTANIDFNGMAAGGQGFVAGNYFHGSTSTAMDSITGGTDTVTGIISDTAFEFSGNNYLET